MATAPGGLTTTIRRKLQEGKSSDDIVRELVAGGMGQVSAQRFVDRALAEDASAPPLPPLTETPDTSAQPADALDQFIQTKTAETQAAETKVGRKSLWAGSLLMCAGIVITGVSYIMAEPGQRFTLMWGPVAFGFFLWGKSVVQGLANFRTYAWFSAIGSIAAPMVLAVVMLGVAVATEPTEEELLQAQLADATEDGGQTSDGASAQAVANRADQPEVFRLLNQFEESESPAVQCDAAAKLSNMKGEDAVDAVDGLMEHYDDSSAQVQTCIRNTVTRLDPAVRF